MRTVEPGEADVGRAPPETLAADDALADPARIGELAHAASVAAQRLELTRPVRLGTDTTTDAALLGLLTEVAGQLVGLHWVLEGEPPWPLRTLVHLPPPADATGPGGPAFAARWRRSHRFGQCTYRRGPGFVAIRDIRPEGPHRRVLIEAEWAGAFIALLTGECPAGPLETELLDELVAADLAVRLAAGHHVLPVRLHRWPIPYNDV